MTAISTITNPTHHAALERIIDEILEPEELEALGLVLADVGLEDLAEQALTDACALRETAATASLIDTIIGRHHHDDPAGLRACADLLADVYPATAALLRSEADSYHRSAPDDRALGSRRS